MRRLPNEVVRADEPERLTRSAPAGPERTCVLTRQTGNRAGLIRLALGPDGAAWPDLGARLPGRGAWVAPDRALLADALAKGRLKAALSRAFRAPVT
ncbi:MAG: YlxR family protein, partial [Sphingomonadaceae bacterium]